MKATVYTTTYCPYCVRAKRMLKDLNAEFEEIDLTDNDELRAKLVAETDHRTVPLIYIGERFIGGFTDMLALHEKGELEPLLRA
jgi:glutaredoxin 3